VVFSSINVIIYQAAENTSAQKEIGGKIKPHIKKLEIPIK
jgi:hypothetical protein